jgi:hypothetical protein
VGGITIFGRLGRGGFGTVYLGRSRLGDWVAVKVVHAQQLGPDMLQRFAREARLSTRIDSPFFAAVEEVSISGDIPFLVSEFIPGPTLAEAAVRLAPWRTAEVTALAAGLAQALDDLSARGLTHRDVKPANVILSERGPVLVDLGIAKADTDTALTQAGDVAGTPHWMAPEQARGEVTSPATDVWAWGTLVSWALSRLAEGESVDPELTRLVELSLSADPASRPTAKDIVTGLSSASSLPDVVDGGWGRISGYARANRHALEQLLTVQATKLDNQTTTRMIEQDVATPTPVPVVIREAPSRLPVALIAVVVAVGLVVAAGIAAVAFLVRPGTLPPSDAATTPVPVVTVTAAASPGPTVTATVSAPAPEPEPPTPEPLPAFDGDPFQGLYDLRAADLPTVDRGWWYATLSTKCAPMTSVDLYGSAGFGFPDGASESYSGGIGYEAILALAYHYRDYYGPGVKTVIVEDVRPDAQDYSQVCGGDPSEPMWLTLNTDVRSSSPEDILNWCVSQGIARGECGAYPVGLPGQTPRWNS